MTEPFQNVKGWDKVRCQERHLCPLVFPCWPQAHKGCLEALWSPAGFLSRQNRDEQLISIIIKLWNQLYFALPQEGVNQKPGKTRQFKPVRWGFLASINGCTCGAAAPTTAFHACTSIPAASMQEEAWGNIPLFFVEFGFQAQKQNIWPRMRHGK